MANPQGTPVALIVEDSEDVRRIYIAELDRMGWESVTALLEEDIEAAIQDNEFDLALLDASFPGLPLEQLKRLIGGIPAIVVSLDDSQRGYNVLQKPFSLDELHAIVEAVVRLESQRISEGDTVRNKVTPDLGTGVVKEIKGDRICVRFEAPPGGRSKEMWCQRPGLVKIRRRREQ